MVAITRNKKTPTKVTRNKKTPTKVLLLLGIMVACSVSYNIGWVASSTSNLTSTVTATFEPCFSNITTLSSPDPTTATTTPKKDTTIAIADNGDDTTKSISFQPNEVQDMLCIPSDQAPKEWKHLCSGDFVKTMTEDLLDDNNNGHINIIQIGAHVGFEKNDPIAKGILAVMEKIDRTISSSAGLRNRLHWTFVEPSPVNFKRLEANLVKHSDLCDMKGVNAAIAPDDMADTDLNQMAFYSVRDTIDPETGVDSISGKKFPYWITQLSSFSKINILTNQGQFRRRGLNVTDYIVETNVVSKRFSDLMRESMGGQQDKIASTTNKQQQPLLVLIDTEGFDCNIINGISLTSDVLPKYLIFEWKSCGNQKEKAYQHLKGMGYYVAQATHENTVAVLMKDSQVKI